MAPRDQREAPPSPPLEINKFASASRGPIEQSARPNRTHCADVCVRPRLRPKACGQLLALAAALLIAAASFQPWSSRTPLRTCNQFGAAAGATSTCLRVAGVLFAAAAEQPPLPLPLPAANVSHELNQTDSATEGAASAGAPIHNRRNEINKQAPAVDPNNNNNSTTIAPHLTTAATATAAAEPITRHGANSAPEANGHRESDNNNNNNNNGATQAAQRTTPTTANGGQRNASADANRDHDRHDDGRQMTNDVLCNSRCNCLQLEFARRAPPAERRLANHEQHDQLQQQRRRLPHQTGGDKKKHDEPLDGPQSSASLSGDNAVGPDDDDDANNNNNNNGKQAPPTSAPAVDLNQVALAEFEQDYSFDDESSATAAAAAPSSAANNFDSSAELELLDDRAPLASVPAAAQPQANLAGQREQHQQQASELDEGPLTGSGLGSALMWLPSGPPPTLPAPLFALNGGGGGPSLPAESAPPPAGNGDRPTIKLAAGDQSRLGGGGGGGAVSEVDRIAAASSASRRPNRPPVGGGLMIDQSGARNLLAARNLTSGAGHTPTPLNGHALLLPSFKRPKPSQQSAQQRQPAQKVAGAHFLSLPGEHHQFGGGQAAAADDKLFSSLHHHHHRRLHLGQSAADGPEDADESSRQLVLERIAPLRSLNLSDQQLGELSKASIDLEREQNLTRLLRNSLDSMHREQSQSLVLRNNNIKFELWTQLYSLLMGQMRAQLYHLDLSHNALIKLGVTFTGYIEHHFVYQLLKSNGTDAGWPFSVVPTASAPTTTLAGTNRTANSTGSYAAQLLNQYKISSSSTSALPSGVSSSASASSFSGSSKRLFRRPILGDGRVYSAVRPELSALINQLFNGSSATLTFPPAAAELAGHQHQHVTGNGSQAATYQQLVQMLLHQPARIKALDLSHNKLKWLINDQFRILKRLQSIRLDHNRIRFIHQQAFNGLLELKYLNLNYNRLQTIYMEQFQTNYQLLALFVKANFLTYLRAGSLASQTNLKRLDLSRNKFTILSNNAFVGLDSLEYLNLSSNSFVHVPSASFHPLVLSLKQLDLSDNQLAQLMPGAFFHLQLEQIYLNDNDQLVSIDRGAFWDLPRLAHLSLRSSSQLLGVNQQAFVGVPQLKLIQLDDCPLLDSQTRQMVDNITRANTMRGILKQQQLAGGNATTSSASNAAGNGDGDRDRDGDKLANRKDETLGRLERVKQNESLNTIPAGPSSAGAFKVARPPPPPLAAFMEEAVPNSYQQQVSIQLQYDQTSATQKITKYFYSLGAILLVVAALKLVFKFTSTRHYLDIRRRRRRVYQTQNSLDGHHTGANSDDLSSQLDDLSSSSSSSRAMDDHDDDKLDGGAESLDSSTSTGRQRHGAAGARTQSSISSLSRNSSSSSPPPLELGGESFALVEQQPQNVLKLRTPARVSSGSSSPRNDSAADYDDQIEVLNDQSDTQEPDGNLTEIDLGSSSVEYHQCCPDCFGQQQPLNFSSGQMECCDPTGAEHQRTEVQQQQQAPGYDNDELLHNLAAAVGLCSYEHANCAHCYQSLGPPLQQFGDIGQSATCCQTSYPVGQYQQQQPMEAAGSFDNIESALDDQQQQQQCDSTPHENQENPANQEVNATQVVGDGEQTDHHQGGVEQQSDDRQADQPTS